MDDSLIHHYHRQINNPINNMSTELSTKHITNTDTNNVLSAIFDISDYLISKGFKKLLWEDLSSENQGRCEYHYCRFVHDNWNGAIVIWKEDDNQMAIGNSDDVDIPESEVAFFEQIKLSRQDELLTILNGV